MCVTVCMHVPASVDACVHISVCLLKACLLSPLNLGDVTQIPGISLVGNQLYIGFFVSRAESKPPEIWLRKAVPVEQIGKGLISSGEIIKALERQWAWPAL